MESKNQTNKTKQKQTPRYTEQTSGYQWGEGSRKGQDRGRGLRCTNYYFKINKVQGYIVQRKEYSHYFIVPLNGV